MARAPQNETQLYPRESLPGLGFRSPYHPYKRQNTASSAFYEVVKRVEFYSAYPHDSTKVKDRSEEVCKLVRQFEILWTDLDEVNLSEGRYHEREFLAPSWSRAQGDSYNGYRYATGGRGSGAGGGSRNEQQGSNQGQRTERLGTSTNGSSQGQSNKRKKNDNPAGNPGPSGKKLTTSGPEPLPQYHCWIYLKSGSRDASSRCSETFESFKQMLQHLLSIHIRPYQCAQCFDRYGRGSERNRHQRSHCRPKRLTVPNVVPNYVTQFSQLIMSCSDEDTLNNILYFNGKKQYDILDDTDELQGVSEITYPGCPTIFTQQPVSLNPLIEESSVGGTPSFPTDDEISQSAPYSVSGSVSENLLNLTLGRRKEFLAQVEQEFARARQEGSASVGELARQIAELIPFGVILYQNVGNASSTNRPTNHQRPRRQILPIDGNAYSQQNPAIINALLGNTESELIDKSEVDQIENEQRQDFEEYVWMDGPPS